MRYIYRKLWDAKLCEALVTRNMKGKIVGACPNIQIGGMLEESNKMGIINTFDMEKFFDKKSLMEICVKRSN